MHSKKLKNYSYLCAMINNSAAYDIRTLARQYANLCFAYTSAYMESAQFIERIAHDHGTDVANIVMNTAQALAKDMIRRSGAPTTQNTCKL